MLKKFTANVLMFVFLVTCIFTTSPVMQVSAATTMRMTVDNSHPLLICPVYGDPTNDLWYGNTLVGAWNLVPDDVKPYTVIELHPGKICTPNVCVPHDTTALRAWFIKMLDLAQSNNIPVIMVVQSAGATDTVPTDWVEQQFANYSVLKGIMNSENYWCSNNTIVTNAANYIASCAKYGAYYIWHDQEAWWWEQIMTNSSFYNACVQNPGNVILSFKNTPAQDCASTDSVIKGFWLSGLTGNWGGDMDTWKWWERGDSSLFAAPGKDRSGDLRTVTTEPESMLGMEMMNIYCNGGTVYNFEDPLYTFADNDTASLAFTKGILPFFRYAIQNPAPSKATVLANTKVAFWGKDGGISQMSNFFIGLSNDDNRMPLYATGRYDIIPVIPAQLSQSDVTANFPGVTIVTKNSSELSDSRNYFNSKYPKLYNGNAFAERLDNRWFVYNSNANVDVNQTAQLPLYTNSCDELDMTVTPHTYAIVNEQSNKLDITLNNYRVDKTSLWNLPASDYNSSDYDWGQSGVNLGNWISNTYVPNPADTTLRTTTLTLKGHTGGSKPVISISGDSGHYNYTDSWDSANETYTITINHNGAVNLTINAWGKGSTPMPQAGTTNGGPTFYQNNFYGGNAVTLAAGNYTMAQMVSAGIPNDSVSSIKVPTGYTVTGYQNDNYGGTAWNFTYDNADLTQISGCNDNISSIKIAQNAPTFYQDTNFGGAAVTLAAGSYTMAQMVAAGIPNDSISSIKVPSGYTVIGYQDDNFGAAAWAFRADNANLWQISGCNDNISSIRIVAN